MSSETLSILVVSLAWGGYPLIARAAGAEGPRATFVLMASGLLPIVLSMLRPSEQHHAWPAQMALTKLVIAGLVMGIGLLAYHAILTSKLDASVSVPIVNVSMLIVSSAGAMLFFGEPVTLQKLGGIALLLGGIALLRPA